MVEKKKKGGQMKPVRGFPKQGGLRKNADSLVSQERGGLVSAHQNRRQYTAGPA